MAGYNLDDYVDVAQRIHEFYERFPEGKLTTGSQPYIEKVGDALFVVYHAKAYRTPDDPLPGDGWAWEPVPGPTQFTRDSELQNAETAAWGRAIVALGFATKKIASKQEVRNRQADAPAREPTASNGAKVISAPQMARMWSLARGANLSEDDVRALMETIAGVSSSKEIPVSKYDALCAAIEAEGLPFR